MKKIFILLFSLLLLVGCVESIALLGGSATHGKVVQSSLKSAVSYGVKKQTGKTPLGHVLAYAEENNPNHKKEKCISFIKKTNSEACMIINKKIALTKAVVEKKISSTKIVVKEKTKIVLTKTAEVKNENKKFPRDLILAFKTKIKEYDSRWYKRIEKSQIKYLNH